MKKKIEEALRTEYPLGFSDKTYGRFADYILGLDIVKEETDIATAVKRDDVKLLFKSVQGEIDGLQKAKKTAEDALADYKSKNPEKNPEDTEDGPVGQQDIAKIVAEAVAAAVKPVQDAFETFKSQTSAKEAKNTAKSKFYENKWTTKFKDEADEAWERAFELNEAKGSTMTAEELSAKATEYFNKSVQRKGTDATKPFEAEKGAQDNFDFSKQVKYLEGEGLLPEEKK